MRTLLLSVLFVLAVPGAQAFFEDVPTSHPHFDAINEMELRGTVKGYGNGIFAPDAWISRAEFVKILMEGYASDEQIDSCLPSGKGARFSDVDASVWYAKYVCLASVRGLVKGYPDGTFRPDRGINTAEAAVILTRTFIGPQDESGVWYRSSVDALGSRGMLPTTLRHLAQSLRRGQMAEMVYRLSGEQKNLPSWTGHDLEVASLSTVPSSYEYDWAEHKPLLTYGQRVGGMTFSGVKNGDVIFTGDIVITGRYYDDSGEGLSFGGFCMERFDRDSIDLIPGSAAFCLTNNALTKLFPKGTSGTATVRLSSLTRSHCECESWSTAVVTEVLSVTPDPTDEVSCNESGGDWQANAVRRSYYDGNDIVTERGLCYPKDSPFAKRMTEFDGCGSFPSYSAKPWYADLKAELVVDRGIAADNVTDVCAALDNSMVVLLVWVDATHSQVWRYDVAKAFLEQARMLTESPESHMDEFLKREGHIIPLIERKDIPGFCRSESHAAYDYVSNTLTGFGGGCVEMYN